LEVLLQEWLIGTYFGESENRDDLKKLEGQTVAFALQGARRFRSGMGGTGLGLLPYDGCHIVVFERDLGPAGDELMKSLKAKAANVKELVAQSVVVLETKWEGVQWRFFFTRPKPNILLVATDQPYLEEVLKRMRSKAKDRALPDNLPEWKHVDKKARFWAIRHLDKANALNDVTQTSLSFLDDELIGIVFNFNPPKSNMARSTFLSGNKEAGHGMRKALTSPKEGMVPKIRQSSPGVVEMETDMKNEKPPSSFLLGLLCALGHGIGT
jgi:hypothetical protein